MEKFLETFGVFGASWGLVALHVVFKKVGEIPPDPNLRISRQAGIYLRATSLGLPLSRRPQTYSDGGLKSQRQRKIPRRGSGKNLV